MEQQHFLSGQNPGNRTSYRRAAARLAFEADEQAIGDVLEAVDQTNLKDSTTIIIVGDHGFRIINTVFKPNMMLQNVNAAFMIVGGSAFLYPYLSAKKNHIAAIIKSVTDSLNKLTADKRKLFRIIDRKELDKMGAHSTATLALAAMPGLVFSGSVGAVSTYSTGPGTKLQESNLDGVFLPKRGCHHCYGPNIPQMWTGFIAAGTGIT